MRTVREHEMGKEMKWNAEDEETRRRGHPTRGDTEKGIPEDDSHLEPRLILNAISRTKSTVIYYR